MAEGGEIRTHGTVSESVVLPTELIPKIVAEGKGIEPSPQNGARFSRPFVYLRRYLPIPPLKYLYTSFTP